MSELEDFIEDPSWFLDAIYVNNGYMDYYKVSRELLTSSSFLDGRMTSHAFDKQRVPFYDTDLEKLSKDFDMSSINFIFHSSFCRSTLMAKALHVENVSFSLKEPSVLLSLAESIRYSNGMKNCDIRNVVLPSILNLITRLMNNDEQVLIKPTNFANNLLPDIIKSGSKVILMYSDLKSYLISILKYGESGRAFNRQLYTRLMVDCSYFQNLKPQQALLLTDLKVAAMVWRQQLELFVSMIENSEDNQIATLNSAIFKDNQSESLNNAFQFFEMDVSHESQKAILDGDVFQQHSKSSQNVDIASIDRQNLEIEDKHKADIVETLKWAETFKIQHEFSLPLKNALVES